jgi:ABC-type transport system involved in multi-copper enzyme maturation permease subunit
MKALHVVYAIARADFLERVRRYSYLVTLLFAVYLGYAAGTGQISLRLGNYRGLYTSAWIGAMVSLVTTTFVSLVGFYIVKNAVDRDRQTGVGEILAATPLSKASYLLGKFLSNFAVLLSMVVVPSTPKRYCCHSSSSHCLPSPSLRRLRSYSRPSVFFAAGSATSCGSFSGALALPCRR